MEKNIGLRSWWEACKCPSQYLFLENQRKYYFLSRKIKGPLIKAIQHFQNLRFVWKVCTHFYSKNRKVKKIKLLNILTQLPCMNFLLREYWDFLHFLLLLVTNLSITNLSFSTGIFLLVKCRKWFIKVLIQAILNCGRY